MKKKIYVVEDDYGQAQWTMEVLTEAFRDTIIIEHIATHHGFGGKFEEIAASQPACIILDVMLPWTDTAITEEPPSLDSFMTAGIHCCEQLRKDPRTARIPVLIYTVLDRSDLSGLPNDVEYLRKDSQDRRLVGWVEKALA